ncbi:hypothetical protein [Marinifilum caeruleilacunae]|uniref:Uncharacterized protein n=1 Tax=Marinifilum caeruleilacunae TaxID=2499076 RepID=A0ABX1WXI8_9BACT|nr:hypothetical protein [Marinifilum caeruleilacunae]NOU60752.1 hypothetical protein [Marinifilum caeruleilacunae]
MIKLITSGEWRDVDSKAVCSFFWTEPDQSINISFKSGDKAGKSDSHKFVKLYLSKEQQKDCHCLQFQSNLFTSEFSLESENSHLFVSSKVFGEMELERL